MAASWREVTQLYITRDPPTAKSGKIPSGKSGKILVLENTSGSCLLFAVFGNALDFSKAPLNPPSLGEAGIWIWTRFRRLKSRMGPGAETHLVEGVQRDLYVPQRELCWLLAEAQH